MDQALAAVSADPFTFSARWVSRLGMSSER